MEIHHWAYKSSNISNRRESRRSKKRQREEPHEECVTSIHNREKKEDT